MINTLDQLEAENHQLRLEIERKKKSNETLTMCLILCGAALALIFAKKIMRFSPLMARNRRFRRFNPRIIKSTRIF